MRYKNNFTIHTTKQLIDINKGILNFNANISITSQNEDDNYDIVIVTQKDLDNIDFELNYRNINNYINVDVSSNNNEHNDYVLVIKSDNKINVEIDINLIDLDDKPPQQPPPQQPPPPPQQPPPQQYQQQPPPQQYQQQPPPQQYQPQQYQQQPPHSNMRNNKPNYLFYVGIIILACLLIYYLFFYSSKKSHKIDSVLPDNNSVKGLSTIDTIDIRNNSKPDPIQEPIVSQESDFQISMEDQKGASLLEQLRGLRN
jgi:hypothetical protein